ncbi:MAG: 30S ribosomal protein S4 [Candidatus Omnitrophota bacterium]|nr:MAG: 30S ribosomal protein S4 [Candidatus Omnitrophota bacterium]
MARYLKARCKLCRREGMKLFLKGVRCVTEKCPFVKRPQPPGMHTRTSSKPSYYALQLREKQKVKRMYGALEKQFKRFFRSASKSKGVTGRMLLQLLERRLDNVIYRSLFALSRSQARQFVRHGFVFINGRRANIPSYIVKEGQTIDLRAKDTTKKVIKENIEINSKERSVVSWLEVDNANLKARIVRVPEKEDISIPVNEQFIVELYSK